MLNPIDDSGHSLVEILVAVTILSILVLGIGNFIGNSTIIRGRSDQYSEATFLARRIIENVRDHKGNLTSVEGRRVIEGHWNSGDGIADMNFPGDYGAQLSISDLEDNDLYHIDLEISWNNGEESISLDNIIFIF